MVATTYVDHKLWPTPTTYCEFWYRSALPQLLNQELQIEARVTLICLALRLCSR